MYVEILDRVQDLLEALDRLLREAIGFVCSAPPETVDSGDSLSERAVVEMDSTGTLV